MTVNLTDSRNAQQRGWGRPGDGERVRVCPDLPGLPLNVRVELAPLFVALVAGLEEIRRAARVPALSCAGGYSLRYISGTTTWSNHAWATAADFNPGANPYDYTGRTDFPVAATRALAHALGFRWGLDYKGKKDAMHFEFMGTPDDARELARHLGRTLTSTEGDDELTPEQDKMLREVWSALTAEDSVGPREGGKRMSLRTMLEWIDFNVRQIPTGKK